MKTLGKGIVVALLLLSGAHLFGNVSSPEVVAVSYDTLDDTDRKQVDCLATNMFFESRGQSMKGQLAVAMVTVNRTKSPAYPDTICGVVKQKVKSSCQFSWWCDAHLKAKAVASRFNKAERDMLAQMRELATWVYLNHDDIKDVTRGATHFHSTNINPGWSGLRRTVQIGEHIFYRNR